ncbi:hypothetical protein FHETE_10961 [Fusarium heterosporum]|uniref:Uncharacterized protein n=1 Tax=Fusarium heterosporum TaxID=42747 RepID=A0A8H5STC9_FUSHE|nr:hypothetical protein FHETE_10961 [Fusarium heterosporum]
MPSFQGLEVAIVTQPNNRKLPEFPLSDASCQDAKNISPRISVYIPSVPGCITRSLCEPSARWTYKEDGMLLIRDGIEARCFSFLPSTKQSIAEDGGFIEIQVFRAKGRRRRIPVIENHRDQEAYGIGSPSGGLLDWPEEACFYDWILADSKEYPFVSFRFHYRSLSNLRQLNIAPDATGLEDLLIEASDASAPLPDSSGGLTKGEPPASFSEAEVSTELGYLSSPHVSNRPLPEIPIQKPTPQKDLKSCTLITSSSTLSAIYEETEGDESSIITTFPVQSDSLYRAKPRPLELREGEESVDNQASSTIENLPINQPELSRMVHPQATSAVENGGHKKDKQQAEEVSDSVSNTTESNIIEMADTGWLRFLGASRTRPQELTSRRSEAALQDLLKHTSLVTERHNNLEKKTMAHPSSCQGITQSDRGTTASSNADSALDEEDKLFINAAQQVWHSPSIDQIAESLRVALMTTPANKPLPPEYRPHILLLCEAYGTRHSKIANLELQLEKSKDALKQETSRNASIEEHWMVQEVRYKAEVKRLEMFIHRMSDKGMEAVALARAGSLIRGTKPRATTREWTATGENAVDEGTSGESPATTLQSENTTLALNMVLPSRQGTVLSRTRTIDTSNEIRLSKGFRNLDNSEEKVINGTRRHKAREVEGSKAHHEQDRAEQPPRSASTSSIGPKKCGIVTTTPREGTVEKKRDSSEKEAATSPQKVGEKVVSQDQPNSTSIAHMPKHNDGHTPDMTIKCKPGQSSDQNHHRHHRQFSFVPGDDITTSRSGNTISRTSAIGPPRKPEVEIGRVDTDDRTATARQGRHTRSIKSSRTSLAYLEPAATADEVMKSTNARAGCVENDIRCISRVWPSYV